MKFGFIFLLFFTQSLNNFAWGQNCSQSLKGLERVLRSNSSDKEDELLTEGYEFKKNKTEGLKDDIYFTKCWTEFKSVSNYAYHLWLRTSTNTISLYVLKAEYYIILRDQIIAKCGNNYVQKGSKKVYFTSEFEYSIEINHDATNTSETNYIFEFKKK